MLLKEIQGIAHRFEGTRHVHISLDDAWEAYYNIQQGQHQDIHAYLKEYQSIIQVLEHYGAAIGTDAPYLAAMTKKLTATFSLSGEELKKRALAGAKLQTIAMGFMKLADRRCYGALWTDSENNYTLFLAPHL